jgi:tRNA (guanine37-N1)-methyltransferase
LEIHIITAFPKLFDGPFNESILKRAQKANVFSVHFHDIRAYSTDKHNKIDDYPYGGGAGMILKPEPLFQCVKDVYKKYALEKTPLILMSAAGHSYNQKKAVELSLQDKLVILCGHYKGIDQRVIDGLVDEEISIGDFILTGGELAAIAVVDSVVRLLPGSIGDIDSAINDSFQTGILDHPHYTRPVEFQGKSVPKVLLSGNHAEIEKWRKDHALQVTQERRKDIYLKYLESEN